ncbi:hypothetical protein Tco_0309727 [Tanacetum coccineum]
MSEVLVIHAVGGNPKDTPPDTNGNLSPSIGNVKPNVSMPRLVEIILFIIDYGCSKHMTGNLKLLTNFMEKFLGMVKFGNDQIAPILDGENLDKMKEKVMHVFLLVFYSSRLTGLSPGPQSQENVPQVAETVTTSNELELLYSLMFSEILNGTSPVVPKNTKESQADSAWIESMQKTSSVLIDSIYGYLKRKGMDFKESLHQLLGWIKYLVRQLGMRCLTPDELEVLEIESA